MFCGRYTLNIWDVGGQKTIRSYWRNYFEQTDGLIWVVDSSDLRRLDDCKMELDNLLKEEVSCHYRIFWLLKKNCFTYLWAYGFYAATFADLLPIVSVFIWRGFIFSQLFEHQCFARSH